MVGAKGFEPSALWSQTRCANQTALRPVYTSVASIKCLLSFKKNWNYTRAIIKFRLKNISFYQKNLYFLLYFKKSQKNTKLFNISTDLPRMSDITIGGSIYNVSVPLKSKLTTLKQRQQEASAELASQGLSATDAKTQAIIEQLNAQIKVLEKQLSVVNQHIRQVMGMKDDSNDEFDVSNGDMLNAKLASDELDRGRGELGSVLASSATNNASIKIESLSASSIDASVGSTDASADVSSAGAGFSFNAAASKLAGLVSLDPANLPDNTKEQKLQKLTAQKTMIENQISEIESKINSLLSGGLNALA